MPHVNLDDLEPRLAAVSNAGAMRDRITDLAHRLAEVAPSASTVGFFDIGGHHKPFGVLWSSGSYVWAGMDDSGVWRQFTLPVSVTDRWGVAIYEGSPPALGEAYMAKDDDEFLHIVRMQEDVERNRGS